jgi:hypothetical protein
MSVSATSRPEDGHTISADPRAALLHLPASCRLAPAVGATAGPSAYGRGLVGATGALHHRDMQPFAVRAVSLFFALTWLWFPGFGLVDLWATRDPGFAVVLEAGWGLFFSVIVAVPFLHIAFLLRRSGPAVAQLWVAVACLVLAGVVSLEALVVYLSAFLAVEVALVGTSPSGNADSGAYIEFRERWFPIAPELSRILLVLAATAAVPCVVYAWRMSALNRAGDPADVTLLVDHYSVQAALALAILSLAGLAAVWPRGRRPIGTAAGVCAAYLGVVSYAWPGAKGGLARPWSAAAVLWGLGFAVAAWVVHRAAARRQSDVGRAEPPA